MKIITRYILKEFFKLWLLGVLALGLLVLISEFFRELRLYLTSQAGLITIVQFLLLSFPHWTLQGLPLATMLAVLFVLTRLEHRGEIVAIKSSGINLNVIIRPFLFCGLLVALLALTMENVLIPRWSRRARLIKEEKILQHPVITARSDYNLLTISPDQEIYLGRLDADAKQLQQVLLTQHKPVGLTRIIFSAQATFRDNEWIFRSPVIYELNVGNKNLLLRTEKKNKLSLSLNLTPVDLLPRFGFNPEEMSFSDYKKFLQDLRKLGYWPTRTWIQFYRKFFEPLTNFIVVLLALALALSFSASSSRLFNFTLSLVLAAAYWLVSAIGETFGEMGLISPIMAASLGFIIFGVAALWSLSRIRR